MAALPTTGVFNDGYIAELFESYRRDPESVDASWRELFGLVLSLAPAAAARSGPSAPDTDRAASAVGSRDLVPLLRSVAGAAALVEAIRNYGHLAVQLDPLGSPPLGAPELSPEFHGITEADLGRVPGAALGFDDDTAADVVARLRALYCGTIGFELEHLEDEHEREWFRRTIEGGEMRRELTPDEKQAVLRRLTEVDGLERFLGRAYLGHKRFSIEGTDTLVPMLDAAIERAAAGGTREVAMAMAHRGRLNVLAHILGKPYRWLFDEFEGKPAGDGEGASGDVKYHLGARGERATEHGDAEIVLLPNPSHLEFVNPVLNGVARAHQTDRRSPAAERDELAVMPVCVHGDAAFIGEGIVAETFNLSRLRGYRTGGTLHIIINNQVGFTTDPSDGRSTYYASDLAKGFDVPVLHVNGDDPEGCIAATWLAVAYRERFRKDFLIDLVGYRRHGHNEGDEPTYTQPQLYASIKAHPTPRQVWGARLVREELLADEDVEALDREFSTRLEEIHAAMKRGEPTAGDEQASERPAEPPRPVETAVPADRLTLLNEQIHRWPSDMAVHPRLAKQLEKRKESLQSGGIDWGYAEALAFASLLVDGVPIRLSGQDAERGTFSHRHAVLHDTATGRAWAPLAHLDGAKAPFEIYNSPLSETAVLGFEYGYSTAAEESLVLWEAQFGDFVNVAQPIIDQFIASDRVKWGQTSSIVMLLPHGYEGQGPEHSSARLERFLQLVAEDNMIVAYPSTPAQYFHLLRRQAHAPSRRPLVLMQPKSLLRLPEAASSFDQIAGESFRPVIDDPVASRAREAVRRLVFCSGKLYYDLDAARGRAAEQSGESPGDIAFVRVEELAPWPHEEVARIVDLYPAIEDVVWAQEEPRNMGAWSYVSPRLRACTGNALVVRYIGRPERASPAEGYASAHKREQERILRDVRTLPARKGRRDSGRRDPGGKREAGSTT